MQFAEPHPPISDSEGLGWGLIKTFFQVPSDAAAPGTTL